MYMQQLEQGGSVETLESYAELDSALTPLNVMYAGMPWERSLTLYIYSNSYEPLTTLF